MLYEPIGRIIPARNAKHVELAAPKANNCPKRLIFCHKKKGCPKNFGQPF